MSVACSRCGKTIHFVSGPFCSHCGAPLSNNETVTATIPQHTGSDKIVWETEALSTAPLSALITTFIDAIRFPDQFFKKVVSSDCSLSTAWIFALTSGSIGLAATWLWSMLYIRYGASFEFLAPLFDGKTSTPYLLLFAPIVLSLQLLCSAAYVTIMFRFARFKRIPFSPVFRVICYAEAPMVLQIVPVLGTFIATLLWVYAVLTGLHHLYSVSKFRVFMQLLMPIFILSVLLAMLLTAGILGGMIGGASAMLDPWSIIGQFLK